MLESESRSRASVAGRILVWCGLALMGAAVLSGLVEPLLTLNRFVLLDPNEGWNAFLAQMALNGDDLYSGSDSLIVNNYPPVSFYLVGLLGRVAGDNVFAGRAVALASMLIVAGNVFVWLRATGSAARVALIGAAVFAAFAVTYARSYAGMDDPQWLAHAFMTTGMVVLWRGGTSSRAIVAAAILMLIGGWTKHLLVPLPIAATWWLLRRPGPGFITWAVSAVLLLAASFLFVRWQFGPAFFASLENARQYSRPMAIKHTLVALKCFAPIIALSALLLLPRARRDLRAEFVTVYLLVSGTIAAIASGGIGVDINAFFDLMIAASMGAALAIDALWSWRFPTALRGIEFGPTATFALGLCLAAYAASLLPNALAEIRNLDAAEQMTLMEIRLIRARGHGRTACESPQLCYWAKGTFTVDFFNVGQKLKVGTMPETSCESIFRGSNIPLIQLDPTSSAGGSILLPAACNVVIARNYRPILTSPLGTILAP